MSIYVDAFRNRVVGNPITEPMSAAVISPSDLVYRVAQIISEKSRFKQNPTNFAMKKSQLMKVREMAQSQGDEATVDKINQVCTVYLRACAFFFFFLGGGGRKPYDLRKHVMTLLSTHLVEPPSFS